MKTNLFNSVIFTVLASTSLFAQKFDLTVSPSISNPICYGQANGSIIINPNGGAGPYTYLWSTGDTTSSLYNLTAGNYTVTVTDAYLSSLSTDILLTQPDEIAFTAVVTNASAIGASDGAIDVSVTGVMNLFVFEWTTNDGNGIVASEIDQTTLTNGTYSLTATNVNGCSASQTYSIIDVISVPFDVNVAPNFLNHIANEISQETVVNFFPNPAYKSINFRSGLNTRALEIYNSNGRQMSNLNIQNESADIQTLELDKGTYFAIFHMIDGSIEKQMFVIE